MEMGAREDEGPAGMARGCVEATYPDRLLDPECGDPFAV